MRPTPIAPTIGAVCSHVSCYLPYLTTSKAAASRELMRVMLGRRENALAKGGVNADNTEGITAVTTEAQEAPPFNAAVSSKPPLDVYLLPFAYMNGILLNGVLLFVCLNMQTGCAACGVC